MQRKWREWLSNHLYDYWLENGHYRRLRFMLEDHQTPEYRIAEDARVARPIYRSTSCLDCLAKSRGPAQAGSCRARRSRERDIDERDRDR